MGAHSMSGANAAKWASWGAKFVSIGADSVLLAMAAGQELSVARGQAKEGGGASTPYG
jgi:2-keto-3-deoxy-L-rhamnonate aldolase RhmA